MIKRKYNPFGNRGKKAFNKEMRKLKILENRLGMKKYGLNKKNNPFKNLF